MLRPATRGRTLGAASIAMVGYDVIIAATDFSELSVVALEAAAEMGRRFHARRVHVVHVVKDPPNAVRGSMTESAHGELIAHGLDHARAELERIPTPPGNFRFTREVRVGNPAKQLAGAADELGATLVVVASHGYGPLRRAIVGSVAGDLSQVAHCPVLVVGRERPLRNELAKVLVALDLSSISELLLKHALALAAPSSGTVRALSIQGVAGVAPGDDSVVLLSPEDADRVAKQQYDELEHLVSRVATGPVRVIGEVASSARPAGAILDVAEREQADIVVIGTSGHGAWHRVLLGSTAMKVLSEARCPVLLIPHEVREKAAELASVAAV